MEGLVDSTKKVTDEKVFKLSSFNIRQWLTNVRVNK